MKRDTFELIRILEGDVKPCADSHIDKKHLANLKEWCDISERMTDEILDCANADSLESYASAKEIIDYSRRYLIDLYKKIDCYINDWDEAWEEDC